MPLEVLKRETSPSVQPVVSIVIPLLNKAENVLSLYESPRTAMKRGKRTWEVIFIDDGSTDNTFRLLQYLHGQDDHVRALQLRRNFGKTFFSRFR